MDAGLAGPLLAGATGNDCSSQNQDRTDFRQGSTYAFAHALWVFPDSGASDGALAFEQCSVLVKRALSPSEKPVLPNALRTESGAEEPRAFRSRSANTLAYLVSFGSGRCDFGQTTPCKVDVVPQRLRTKFSQRATKTNHSWPDGSDLVLKRKSLSSKFH